MQVRSQAQEAQIQRLSGELQVERSRTIALTGEVSELNTRLLHTSREGAELRRDLQAHSYARQQCG